MGNLIKEIKMKIFDTLYNLNLQNIKFVQETFQKTNNIKDIEILENEILQFFAKNFKLKYKEIRKYLNDIENYIVDKCENDEINNKIQIFKTFTSKDIQDYYSKIIDNYKEYSVNYIDDNEPENKTIVEFLEKLQIFQENHIMIQINF